MSKKPRQSKVRDSASIVNGQLYYEDVRQCSMSDPVIADMLEDKNLVALRVVSLPSDWAVRVFYSNDAIATEDLNVEMTLRKEVRGQIAHWYAYRRVFGRLHKRYVGKSEDITESRLVTIAQALPSAW